MATRKKNNTGLFVIGGAVILGGLAYLFRDKLKSVLGFTTDDEELGGNLPKDDNALVVVKDKDNNDIVVPVTSEKIKRGDKGAQVSQLQKLINLILKVQKQNSSIIEEDGDFGKNTDKALLIFSDDYKKNKYTTIALTRNIYIRNLAKKGLPFPEYYKTLPNKEDLMKIYLANLIKK